MRKTGWICSVLSTFLLLFSLSFSGHTQTWTPKYVSMTAGTGGYFEYLPVGYGNRGNANKRYPVILFIQGVGDMGNGTTELDRVRRNGLPTVIDAGQFPNVFTVNGEQFSFIAIVPQFSGWPNPTQIHNILDFIETNYRADASRLYMTGLSMGGGATWDYAGASLANANRLAAILPVCGASNPNSSRIQNIANAKLPVLATHNDLDPTVTVDNTIGYVNGINGYNINPPAVKLIWQGDYHNCWGRTYDPYEKLFGNLNAYEWLLQYSRGVAAPPPPPPPPPLSVNISASNMPVCFGNSNGSATAQASGGTAPYTFSWNTSPSQTSATANNLVAGNYTVTVRDANGISTTANIAITQPDILRLNASAGTIPSNGGSTSVALSATGGTPPYTFDGATTNVRAGSYTYTVTDAKGCKATSSLIITEPPVPPPVVAAELVSRKDVSCSGGSDGSAEIRTTSGLAPFTYSWNTVPAQNTSAAAQLKAGTYTVTVRDANNNSTQVEVNILEPQLLKINVVPGTINFFGGNTNVVSSATGGTAPYTFTGPVNGVKAGTYTYTVTDAKGCSDVKSLTITEPAPAAFSVGISSIGSVSCYNGTDGSAIVSVTGGTAPFVYTWNTTPAQSGAIANGLRAGNYSLTVLDANGQSASVSFVVPQPAPLQLNVTSGNIAAFNGSTTVELQAAGGTQPYTFSGGPTVNVTAGTYTYRVIDLNGCVKDTTISISQPAPAPTIAPLSLSVSTTDVNCFDGSDGTATVEARNGTPPYTYTWSTVPAQSTQTAVGLKAGTYTVTVRDANGVSSSAAVTIVQPTAFRLQIASGTIPFFGGTTSVTLSASGGSAPYLYTGETQNLSAGNYIFIAKDAKGCSATGTITLVEPQQIVLTATADPIRCTGGTTNVNIDIKGGVAPYQLDGNTKDLKAGTYRFIVIDSQGGRSTTSIEIKEPLLLVLSVSAANIEVNGGNTNVVLLASGGVAPYVYSGNSTNVVAGTHMYTVTDANGCTATTSVTLTQPDPVVLRATAGLIRCFGGTTNVSLSVQGGRAPYTFTGDTIDLRAGTHTFSVVDSKGSKASALVVLKDPEKLELIATPEPIRKIGGTTDVVLNAKGGKTPYTYFGTTSGVKAGVYQYEVTDANNCRASADAEVREPGVKLTSFDVNKGDTAVSLKWTTSYEYAIDYFEIERSTDSYKFTSISKTTSLWNSVRLANYLVRDSRPALNRNYYRIVAVTLYGERIMQDEKNLLYDSKLNVVVRNMINQLDITIEDQHLEDIQVNLYDLNGRPLKSSKFSKQYYLFNTKLSMEWLPKGSYIVSINSAHIRYAKQVIKL